MKFKDHIGETNSNKVLQEGFFGTLVDMGRVLKISSQIPVEFAQELKKEKAKIETQEELVDIILTLGAKTKKKVFSSIKDNDMANTFWKSFKKSVIESISEQDEFKKAGFNTREIQAELKKGL